MVVLYFLVWVTSWCPSIQKIFPYIWEISERMVEMLGIDDESLLTNYARRFYIYHFFLDKIVQLLENKTRWPTLFFPSPLWLHKTISGVDAFGEGHVRFEFLPDTTEGSRGHFLSSLMCETKKKEAEVKFESSSLQTWSKGAGASVCCGSESMLQTDHYSLKFSPRVHSLRYAK